MSIITPAAADAAPHRINPRAVEPDAKLLSNPDTVLWGYIAANLAPALTIKPGQIVEIEALSHQGIATHQFWNGVVYAAVRNSGYRQSRLC